MTEHDNNCELRGDHDATSSICCCSERREIERLRELLEEQLSCQGQEIERLRQLATQRGARMQIMREWRHMLWDAFIEEHPEAFSWFDEDGVPK